MQELLRWLCAWKGIPVGDGEEVQFEFSGFPSGGLGMLVLLALVLIVVLVVFVYRRDGKTLTTGQRVVLGTLRAAQAAAESGVTDFVLTKLDVLTGLEQVPVCVAYDVGGVRHDEMPVNQTDFHHRSEEHTS